MEKSYYLSEGHILGGHYEIVKVLGEDAFEILYLVKDTHRLESLFVIKELFLKAYSRRENEAVQVVAKSKLLFEDAKKEMIHEILELQKSDQKNEVQTYGYLEENNTVYTIMEFVNDPNVEHYFQSNIITVNKPNKEKKSEEIVLPPIQERVEPAEAISKEEKKPKSYIFLKILSVALLIMAGLAYYSWNMIETDKKRVKEQHHHLSVVTEKTVYRPPLNDNEEEEEKPVKKEELKVEEKKERSFNASYIEEGEQRVDSKDDLFDIPNEEVYVDKEESMVKSEPKSEIKIDSKDDLSDTPDEEAYKEDSRVVVKEEPKVKDEPKSEVKEESKIKELGEPISPVKRENPNSLGTQIGGENRTERFNRMSVKRFLDKFLASSTSGTIDTIVSLYDSKVDRYFSLKNVNQNKIRKDKVSYQKKWTKREFRLVAFKIVSIYRKGNFDYCDLTTTIQWNVSSDDFKTSAGRSKGMMTLKRTYDGFKVTSIYTVK